MKITRVGPALEYHDRMHADARAVLEHEAHHRGQLYFILGLRGISTPPIFGLTSEEVYARSRAAEA